ncbi:carbohydrate ABC transporter permease [Deinococcus cellulosilyticus]|uniref:ABC transporter permease n=1 Tax=Deinococcus cellulosilyticus (strain DSM 18568 / NBRC 106333 / KACC 11606 / 5516J-15) TaxID=1223518 RepID=A0A511MZE8_DEIC1|nr:sugar ABC transporter permease [Deinococcus cellulosilyticus]GEM45547.1 ABC transporter permease [Deinococcus cellulosilyticus NBRC 106333 = KACC 11606]
MQTPPNIAAQAASRPRRRSRKTQEWLDELLLIAPASVLLLTFLILPFLMAGYLSFTDERLVPRPIPTEFVGLQNYLQVLQDPDFWQAFRNTAYFVILVVPFQCTLSLMCALLLNSELPLRSMFRSVSLLPLVTPMTVIVVIWAALYRIPDGFMNSILHLFGFQGYVDWLGDARFAMPAIVLLSAWATFPFQMLIFLAGLQDIPMERYEAAKMDGAGPWHMFRYVTLPGLRNTNIFILIITTLQAFKLFTQVDILTRGGPLGSTNTLVRYMVQEGYTAQQVGYASAVAVVFVILVGALAILQRVLLKNE